MREVVAIPVAMAGSSRRRGIREPGLSRRDRLPASSPASIDAMPDRARHSHAMRFVFALFALLVPLSGQGVPFIQVLPPQAAVSEGAASTALPFGSAAARHVMFAYDGSTIGHQHAMRITAIELRPAGGSLGGSAAGVYNFSLSCSTGRNPAASLDPVFANNHGADRAHLHGRAAPPVRSTGYPPPPPRGPPADRPPAPPHPRHCHRHRTTASGRWCER